MGANASIKRGGYLLYLNGLRIPCPSISVSAGVGRVPEISFSLAPHPLLQRLGAADRVEVVVFFLDNLQTEEPKWRLLAEGEITGWAYANTPLGARMNFTATADISIFQQLKYYFMTATDVLGHALNPASGTESVTQPGAYYPFSLFKKGLVYGATKSTAKETITPDVERPFEILFNAVRGMMDIQLQTTATGTPPAVPLINFFARWARKRNFQNRFAALPIFEDTDRNSTTSGVFPILSSVQDDYALKTLATGLAGAGDQGSMWNVLQQVFTTMYFEIAMLPTAPAYRVRLADGRVMGLDGLVDIDSAQDLKYPMRLMNYFVKPQMLFGIPPACNVIFPSMLKSLEYGENYMQQPTRYYVNDSLVTGLLNDQQFIPAALTVGFPEVVNAALRQRMNGTTVEQRGKIPRLTNALMSSGRDVLVYPEEFFKGPVVVRGEVPSWFTLLMSKHASNKSEKPTKDTAPAAGTPTPGQLPADGPAIQELFDTYVRYEFYRRRYETRGGSATMHWNPYIVPGFPCFIFDRETAGMHVAGYVQSVTWNLSTNGLDTSITYGYGRTLQEFLQAQYEESPHFGILGAGPAEMLPTIRDVVQVPDQAEEFYKGLFYGRSTFRSYEGENKPASALLHTLVGRYNGESDEVESIELVRGDGAPAATPNIPKVDGVPDFNIELTPTHGAHDYFVDRDAAMRYVSRPICTMEEYIRFRMGAYPPNDPDVDQMGAPHYNRIYTLRQGPATEEPTPAMVGAAVSAKSSSANKGDAVPYNDAKSALPDSFPQTRVDWDSILEAYVAAMEQSPPQN